jgi:hypothetical protein
MPQDPLMRELEELEVVADRLERENDTMRDLLTAYHGQTELFMQHVNSLTWLGKLHELQALAEEKMPALRAKESAE